MKKDNRLRNLLNILLVVYILIVFYITLVLNREPAERRYSLDLFYSYISLFKYKNYFYYKMILYNILMLVPFGFLVPLLHPKCRKFTHVLHLSFLFSLVIETLQFITKRGLFEADDLLNNTIGGIAGYIIYFILSSIYRFLFAKKKK